MTNRFSYLSTSILLSAVLLLIGCAPSAVDYYNSGLTAYNEGNYSAAMSNFDQAIEIDVNLGQAYYYRGLIMYNHYNQFVQVCGGLQNIAELEKQLQAAQQNESDTESLTIDNPDLMSFNCSYTLPIWKDRIVSEFHKCLESDISTEMRQSAETYLQELTNTP